MEQEEEKTGDVSEPLGSEPGKMSPVESLASSLSGAEPEKPAARTVVLRLDTALVLLGITLVMMVISYVVGVGVGQRELEAGADEQGPAESTAGPYLVQVMSGMVADGAKAKYQKAREALIGLGYNDVEIHAGPKFIYLTVGRADEKDDPKLESLRGKLEGLKLADNSLLKDCNVRSLSDIQEKLKIKPE